MRRLLKKLFAFNLESTVYNEFAFNNICKNIGVCSYFIAITPMALISTTVIKYTITGAILLFAIWCECQYKCPVCGHRFNPRNSYRDMTYCSNCNTQLREMNIDDY